MKPTNTEPFYKNWFLVSTHRHNPSLKISCWWAHKHKHRTDELKETFNDSKNKKKKSETDLRKQKNLRESEKKSWDIEWSILEDAFDNWLGWAFVFLTAKITNCKAFFFSETLRCWEKKFVRWQLTWRAHERKKWTLYK